MEQVRELLKHPLVKVTLISLATVLKFYTPDEVDHLIDNALLVFLGYNAITGTDKKDNA